MKNGALKIERGIPVPKSMAGRALGQVALAMKSMKRGDSVLLHEMTAVNVSQFCQRYLGKGRYASRKEGSGYRVWKTK